MLEKKMEVEIKYIGFSKTHNTEYVQFIECDQQADIFHVFNGLLYKHEYSLKIEKRIYLKEIIYEYENNCG